MDQQKGSKDNLDDEIAMAVLMILSIVILAPVILWKLVESEPGTFDGLTLKESAKGAGVAFGIAVTLWVATDFYPGLGAQALFHIGKWKFHLSTLMTWLITNLILGGMAYLTLPIWKSNFSKKKALKEKLY